MGSAGALVASALMLWAGRAWGGAILPQLIAERATDVLPLDVVRRSLEELENNAKSVALAVITLTQVAGGGLLGFVYSRFARPGVAFRIAGGAALFSISWLLLSIVAAPLGGVGILASEAVQGFARTQAVFILASGVFALFVAVFVPCPAGIGSSSVDGDASPVPGGVTKSRRNLLRTAGVSLVALPALASGIYLGRFIDQLRAVYDPRLGRLDKDGRSIFATRGMPKEITPTPAFYVVSKNFVDPTVDAIDWSLEIDGLVDRPATLSYTDILARDSVELISTLECISNPIGGDFISTAIWTGFPLRELLDESLMQPGVVDIELHATDGYIESIPLVEALAADTIVVHSMNGDPLDDKHGFPVRLIVPGIFGMKNVKWLTRIRPVGEDIQGYWQQRGWSDIATVLTMSRIDIPARPHHVLPGAAVRIGGVAFAGDRGISRVEVTTDGGATWNDAELSDPLSDLTWRLWIYDHHPREQGIQRLAVRATDGTGVLQPETEQETLPDGATGWHRSWYEVRDEQGNPVPSRQEVLDAGVRWVRQGEARPEGK